MEKIKSMEKKCVIVGAGTYGQVYAKYLAEKYIEIVFIDDNTSLHNAIFEGVKVIGNYSYLLSELDKSIYDVYVPIGNNKIRVEMMTKLKEAGYNTPSFIHLSATIHSSVKIGRGVYILPSTSIMPLTQIDDYVMISMGVNVAHHTHLNKGVFLSQGTNVGASIVLQNNAYCCIGSTIMTGVKTVGKNSLIGAGAVVIKDVPENAVVAGVPAKVIKYKG